ncbi:hypothetical protein Pcinc_028343 [Petrolisthes cinctipes]|uniref:Uncharacterized protein n=1 Tax=Petrolisthes cinctipes TaxID=88211 RepID=A0AAE1F297_PETCI|nr:hypothetical protein Pcinc_028343 [Petrolisthes cinctipes]
MGLRRYESVTWKRETEEGREGAVLCCVVLCPPSLPTPSLPCSPPPSVTPSPHTSPPLPPLTVAPHTLAYLPLPPTFPPHSPSFALHLRLYVYSLPLLSLSSSTLNPPSLFSSFTLSRPFLSSSPLSRPLPLLFHPSLPLLFHSHVPASPFPLSQRPFLSFHSLNAPSSPLPPSHDPFLSSSTLSSHFLSSSMHPFLSSSTLTFLPLLPSTLVTFLFVPPSSSLPPTHARFVTVNIPPH